MRLLSYLLIRWVSTSSHIQYMTNLHGCSSGFTEICQNIRNEKVRRHRLEMFYRDVTEFLSSMCLDNFMADNPGFETQVQTSWLNGEIRRPQGWRVLVKGVRLSPLSTCLGSKTSSASSREEGGRWERKVRLPYKGLSRGSGHY